MAGIPRQLEWRLARCDDAELLALTPTLPEAFDAFYVRHSRALAAFLLRQTGDHDVALDLVGETFAIALESVERYDPARGDARAWLFGIAKVTLLASRRSRRAEAAARLRLGIDVGDGGEAWERAEARIDASLPNLVDGLEELPRAEREAVIARVLDERSYAEIASSEQASEAAIRQRVKRGLARLRRQAGRGGR